MSKQGAPEPSRGDQLAPLDEEREIIDRLQAGDHSAFAVLYEWYADPLYRQVIVPRCPNRELAEDCLRDTFRNALEKITTYRLQNRSIFFWLRRIAINKAMDTHRRARRDRKLADAVKAEPEPLTQHASSPDRRLEVEDTERQVSLSLSRLNPRYAQVLRLRLIEGRSRQECASILGVTVGNLDVILHRAAKAFRKVYPP